jgi:hypothetical protein
MTDFYTYMKSGVFMRSKIHLDLQTYTSCAGCTSSECATPDVRIEVNEYEGQLSTQTGKEHTQAH